MIAKPKNLKTYLKLTVYKLFVGFAALVLCLTICFQSF